jgi:hypothetical protein
MAEGIPLTVDWGIDLFDFRLRQIHAHWTAMHRGDQMPLRDDFHASELKSVLPYLFLVEVLPGDFRLRLTGTHFETFAQQKLTGLRVTEAFPPDFSAAVKKLWGEAVETRRPLHAIGQLWVPSRNYVRWEGIILPLASHNGAVEHLLGGVVFSYPNKNKAA